MNSPINKHASQEAIELLQFLYANYGKVTLTGQHDQMYSMGKPHQPSALIEKMTGVRPLMWGGEWGFSDERHDVDNIRYRPLLMDEIRRHHRDGQIVVISYHQASPVVGEPCGFENGVQPLLTSEQYDAVLTPGTELHGIWTEHVDRLAEAFKILQLEKIPIIFRPYHEMNGAWFWWGGESERFLQLWDMTYDRFTHYHQLNNLLWAWNPDKANVGEVEAFFPGLDKVDLVGTDVYPSADRDETFPLEWYLRMKAIAKDKPLALSENSIIPSPEVLAEQPYAYYMCWDKMVFENGDEQILRTVHHPAYRSEM
jgi:mannan endo-1,4-beta-mannosidase